MNGNKVLLMIKELKKNERRRVQSLQGISKSLPENKKIEITSCEQMLSHSIEISLQEYSHKQQLLHKHTYYALQRGTERVC
jgi:hypothetical protein